MQQDIDAEHHDGDHQHHPQQQAAETPEATFELGFGRTQRQGLGDPPDFALLGIARDQHLGGAAAHRGAHEHAIVALPQGGIGGALARCFFHREGFAREQAFADKAIERLQDAAIRSDQAAGAEQQNIPRHHVAGGNLHRLAVATHGGAQGDLAPQLLHGMAGAVFIPGAEYRADQHDAADNRRIQPVPHGHGDQRADDQNQHQGRAHLLQHQPEHALGPGLGRDRGGAHPHAGLGLAQALRRAVHTAEHLAHRRAPVIGVDQPRRVPGAGLPFPMGQPQAGQHRYPECQAAKQQGGGQRHGNVHPHPMQSHHRRCFEGTQAARHDADAA